MAIYPPIDDVYPNIWEQIKKKLETEGAKNKVYDSDLDGVVDFSTNSDKVDNIHVYIDPEITPANPPKGSLLVETTSKRLKVTDGTNWKYVGSNTLVDVTSVRSLGTIYQNTTGRNLLVIVVGTGAEAIAEISDDNFTNNIYTAGGHPTAGPGEYGACVFIVPPNWYYRVSGGLGYSLVKWYEIEI